MAFQWQVVFVCLCIEAGLCVLLSIPLPDFFSKALIGILRGAWRLTAFKGTVIGYFVVAAFLIIQSYQEVQRYKAMKDSADEVGGMAMRMSNMSHMFYHQRNFYISSMTALLMVCILGFIRYLNIIHDLRAKAKAAKAE